MRVYVGSDLASGRLHYLKETVPPGPGAATEAERVRRRLLNQVDERRNPRTRATVDQLLDRWLLVLYGGVMAAVSAAVLTGTIVPDGPIDRRGMLGHAML